MSLRLCPCLSVCYLCLSLSLSISLSLFLCVSLSVSLNISFFGCQCLFSAYYILLIIFTCIFLNMIVSLFSSRMDNTPSPFSYSIYFIFSTNVRILFVLTQCKQDNLTLTTDLQDTTRSHRRCYDVTVFQTQYKTPTKLVLGSTRRRPH